VSATLARRGLPDLCKYVLSMTALEPAIRAACTPRRIFDFSLRGARILEHGSTVANPRGLPTSRSRRAGTISPAVCLVWDDLSLSYECTTTRVSLPSSSTLSRQELRKGFAPSNDRPAGATGPPAADCQCLSSRCGPKNGAPRRSSTGDSIANLCNPG
jgi:hypothetical protein